MTSLRSCFACLAVALFIAVAATPASAQDGRFTGSINFGTQVRSGDFTQRLTPTIYDETATIDIAQTYETGGLFDIGGSFLVTGNIGVGLSYSRSGGDGAAAIAAQIPDPLFFDRPRGASATADGLDHSESAVHVQVQYRFAATPKLDVTVGIGPSFFSVSQQLVETVEVTEASPAPVITPRVSEVSESPVGVNFGADITYMVTPRFGVGGLLRYAAASADFAVANASAVDINAGGFQLAGGVRVRF